MLKILELTIDELKASQKNYILVDVREAHECDSPEGRIEGSIRATLGPDLSQFIKNADLNQAFVFICRSGYRSAKACELAYAHGISKAYNLKGGMLAWNEKK